MASFEEKLGMDLDDIAALNRKAPTDRIAKSRAARRQRISPYKKPARAMPSGGGGKFRSGGVAGARVYVHNLDWSTTWQGLKDHMRSVGTVVRADIMTKRDGRSLGCGIVEFSTKAEARRAIRDMTETNLDGRNILVREDREAQGVGGAGGGAGAGGAGGGAGAGAAAGRGRVKAKPNSAGGKLAFGGRATAAVRLFVGNLDFAVTWQQLKDGFKKAGDAVFAEIVTDNSGRSKGWGFVDFSSRKDADAAIRMFDGANMDGRTLEVRYDRKAGGGRGGASGGGGGGGGRGGKGGSRNVYVGNLDFGVTWQNLKDHFATVGAVAHADVFSTPDGRSAGCGKVVFEDSASADAAIARLNETVLKGRHIFVREDREDPKGTASGGGIAARPKALLQEAREAAAAARRSNNTRLFVDNLSYKVTWGMLKDAYKKFGHVEFAKVKTTDDGLSRGWGIVEFRDAADAATAIRETHGTIMDGRPLFVRMDERSDEV